MAQRGFLHNRRHFLHTAGGAVLAAGTAGRLLTPCQIRAAEAAVSGPADVGIARGSNMEEAVKPRRSSCRAAWTLIKPDQTVLIKPNVTGAAKNPTTTSPKCCTP